MNHKTSEHQNDCGETVIESTGKVGSELKDFSMGGCGFI